MGISFRIQILSTYIKGTAIFLTDIKTRTFSRLAIDFEFQSKIVRNWSLPVAGNRYPLPGFRNGVPCFPNWVPCFHNGISGFSKICPSVWILLLKKHFFFQIWILGLILRHTMSSERFQPRNGQKSKEMFLVLESKWTDRFSRNRISHYGNREPHSGNRELHYGNRVVGIYFWRPAMTDFWRF